MYDDLDFCNIQAINFDFVVVLVHIAINNAYIE